MWLSEKRMLKYILIVAVVSSLLSSAVFVVFGYFYFNSMISNLPPPAQIVINGTAPEEQLIAAVVQNVRNSVVHVSTVSYTTDFFLRPIPVEGTGSGFIISSDGYIVTNNHVVSGASSVTVVLANGREYPATVLGNSLSCDVAVLKLNVGNLKPVKIGNSDLVKPGDFAIAIGSPYALDNTVTFGVISALNRTIQTNAGTLIEGVFQTDAAINPGNSGGPLLNTDGDVIGMNTAIFTTTGAYQGIGFSIPIKTVYSIANRLIDISKTQ